MFTGSVYCFIPKLEKKEKLLQEQIEYERQILRQKNAIEKQGQISKRSSISQQISSRKSVNKSFGVIRVSALAQDDDTLNEEENCLNDSCLEREQIGSVRNRKVYEKQKKIEGGNDEDIISAFVDLNMVKIYKSGEAFGEIALMTRERRTASMVCREDTSFMVLSKEGFARILGKCQESKVREKVSFLKSFSFFARVGDSQLMSLLHFFSEKQFPQKAMIYKEGDSVSSIYFIRQGEVHIQKIVDDDEERVLEDIEKQQTQQKKKKILTIKILGPSQYFGQDEIFQHLLKRGHRAVAQPSTQLLQISKRDLFSALRQYKQVDTFRSQNDIKQQWQQEREQDILRTSDNIKRCVSSNHIHLSYRENLNNSPAHFESDKINQKSNKSEIKLLNILKPCSRQTSLNASVQQQSQPTSQSLHLSSQTLKQSHHQNQKSEKTSKFLPSIQSQAEFSTSHHSILNIFQKKNLIKEKIMEEFIKKQQKDQPGSTQFETSQKSFFNVSEMMQSSYKLQTSKQSSRLHSFRTSTHIPSPQKKLISLPTSPMIQNYWQQVSFRQTSQRSEMKSPVSEKGKFQIKATSISIIEKQISSQDELGEQSKSGTSAKLKRKSSDEKERKNTDMNQEYLSCLQLNDVLIEDTEQNKNYEEPPLLKRNALMSQFQKHPQLKRVFKNKKPFLFQLFEQKNAQDAIK